MTPMDSLTQLNHAINAIPYVSQPPQDDDDWTPIVPTIGGDCAMYATAKFESLASSNWPIDTLRLATCRTELNEMHCVLLVDYENETYVLDNRYPFPTEWELLDYKWKKIQIAGTQRFRLFETPPTT